MRNDRCPHGLSGGSDCSVCDNDRPSATTEPAIKDCEHLSLSFADCTICSPTEPAESEGKCEECRKSIKADDIGFDFGDGRIACKACTKQTEEDWEATKVVLKAEGFDPDKCDFIERSLAAESPPAPPSDATEDAKAFLAEYDPELSAECDFAGWLTVELMEKYAAKQIELQTPAIIERFVEEVEKDFKMMYDRTGTNGEVNLRRAMQAVQARLKGEK